jgi:Recombination endonuclease VII
MGWSGITISSERTEIVEDLQENTKMTQIAGTGAESRQCAICRADDQELHLDHSYRTGRTRGLLWRQCNCALGMLRDSPKKLRAALQYLLKPPAQALQCM